jgi:uncharacterized RDD family membrane protein YckC
VLTLWAILAIVYYVVFVAWLAATPGKLVLGLRVRRADGTRLDLKSALIRNLFRVIDGLPYVLPYLVGADRRLVGRFTVRRGRGAKSTPASR